MVARDPLVGAKSFVCHTHFPEKLAASGLYTRRLPERTWRSRSQVDGIFGAHWQHADMSAHGELVGSEIHLRLQGAKPTDDAW